MHARSHLTVLGALDSHGFCPVSGGSDCVSQNSFFLYVFIQDKRLCDGRGRGAWEICRVEAKLTKWGLILASSYWLEATADLQLFPFPLHDFPVLPTKLSMCLDP